MTARTRNAAISVLMPVWETPPDLLRMSIESVLDQSFRDFELVVSDDGSKAPAIGRLLEHLCTIDDRVRVVRNDVNSGIVAASNRALDHARADFVALVDHDDLLLPDALERCLEELGANPSCDLLYTDEAIIDLAGDVVTLFLKPDWSPERLRSQNYLNHLSVYRRSLVVELGGFRQGFDGSQDYDLALRISERARQIVHVPEVLYHWRIRPGQVSGSQNPLVYEAARRAISEHCQRTGIDATVEQTDALGYYRIHRALKERPLVSLVVPTRGSQGEVFGRERVFVSAALESIVASTTYDRLEFVVVADSDTPRTVLDELRATCGERLRLVNYDHPFDYAHKVNLGVLAAEGEYVVLLNDDVEVITGDWIESLLGLAQQPDVGMVGCALYFEDGSLQHGGHLYLNGVAGHAGYGAPGDYAGIWSAFEVDRECSGVTAACAMMRRQDYLSVGGLSRQFPANFNDVDLCLKIRRTGKRIVWTPWAKLYHFESKSRDGRVGKSEIAEIRRRWEHVLDGDDQYWRYQEPSYPVAESEPPVVRAPAQSAKARPAPAPPRQRHVGSPGR